MAHRNDDGTFRGKQPKKLTNRSLLARWVETEVVRLKRLGMEFPRIAEQLTLIGRGSAKPITELAADLRFPTDYRISMQACHKAYHKAMRREPALAVEEHRRLDAARCEEMVFALQPGLRRGDPKSVDAAVRALSHKAKLLGLESAKRVEMTGQDGGPLTVELFRRLCEQAEEEAARKEKNK
jgi:hypothetical protein